MKIHGIDKSLYKFIALKDGKKVATIKVISYTKFQAYYDCVKYFPEHNGYTYEHIRFAGDDEECGPVLTKNDIKRKI